MLSFRIKEIKKKEEEEKVGENNVHPSTEAAWTKRKRAKVSVNNGQYLHLNQ